MQTECLDQEEGAGLKGLQTALPEVSAFLASHQAAPAPDAIVQYSNGEEGWKRGGQNPFLMGY